MEDRHDAVFVFPYPSTGETFRFPAIFACCSGELKSRGIDSVVVELFLAVGDQTATSAALTELSAWLSCSRPRAVFLSDVFEPGVFAAVRSGVPDAVVVCTDRIEPPPGAVDYVIDRFETNPVTLVSLAAAIVRGSGIEGIPNVRPCKGAARDTVACAGVPMFLAPPDYRFVPIPAVAGRPSHRLSVYVNPGCPWSGSVARNPEFAGADLSDPGLALRGCSFCMQDGRYSGLDAVAAVDRIALELECWLDIHPWCRDMVLWDESPWRFLPTLVDRIASTAKSPLAICFHARTDDMVARADTIREACAAARRHPDSGVTLAVTLIGFENYSAAELARMNKGATPADASAAIAACRRIADEFPEVFEFDRFKASSFILFSPWTTRADLQANIDGFVRDNILEFSTGMGLTRLRLYPGLPILALAARDGLLDNDAPGDQASSPGRFGYSTDVPWRFADPQVDRVYRLYAALYPIVERHDQVDLLDWVVKSVFSGDAARFDEVVIRGLFERLRAAVSALNGNGRLHSPASRSAGRSSPYPPPGGRSGTLEVTLSGAGVPGPGRMPDLSCDPSPGRLAVRIARYGAAVSMLQVIGREPGRSPVFLRAVYLARQSGIPGAAVRTDGTVFREPLMLARAIKAGITDIEFRVFGTDAGSWQAVTGNPDGFADFRAAAALVGASSSVVTSRALVELGLVIPAAIPQVLEVIASSGLDGVSWEAPLAYLPHNGLDAFVDSLESFARDGFSRWSAPC